MIIRESIELARWSICGNTDTSYNNKVDKKIAALMEPLDDNQIAVLEPGDSLFIKWEREKPLYLDEEGFYSEFITERWCDSVKSIMRIGADFIFLVAREERSERVMFKLSKKRLFRIN